MSIANITKPNEANWKLYVNSVTFNDGTTISSASSGSSASTILNAHTLGTDSSGVIQDTNSLYFSGTSIPLTSEGYDVFLLIGQSNSSGFGTSSSTSTGVTGVDPILDYTNPRILQLGQWTGYTNKILLAQDMLQHADKDTSGTSNRIGLHMTFARLYLNILPAASIKRKILLVPAAYGGTGFSGNAWNPGNSYYANAVTRANTAMGLGSVPKYNRFCGFLWHQGEADTGHGGTGSLMTTVAYKAALDAMIAGMRAAITGATNAPFIAGLFTPAFEAAFPADSAQIEAGITDLPNRVAKTYVASSSGLIGDANTGYVHFNAESQRILGQRYFDGYMSIASVPSVVLGLSVVSTGTTTGKLTWIQKQYSNVSYKIYQSSDGTNFALVSTNVDQNTFNITGLNSNTKYYYKIVASNTAGNSGDSTIVNFTTGTAGVPSKITGLASSSITTVSIALTWNADSNASSYKVYKNAVLFGTASTNSIVVNGLNSGTSYTFTVLGTGTADGPLSDPITVSTGSLPAVVSSVTTGTITATSVVLNWTASVGATQYKVNYGLSGGSLSVFATTSSLTTTVTGLNSNTAYSFSITASNTYGDASPSSLVTATTTSSLPAQVTGLSATPSSTSITLNWSSSANASTYKVYSGLSGGSLTLNQTVSVLTAVVGSLSAATAYDFYVVGHNTSGDGTASSTVTSTTGPSLPTPIWELDTNTGSIVVSGSGSGSITASIVNSGSAVISLVNDPDSVKGTVIQRSGSDSISKITLSGGGDNPTASYSKSVWVRLTALNYYSNVISTSTGALGATEHDLYTPGQDGKWSVKHGSNSIITCSTAVTVNTWHHVCATYDSASTTLKIYLDGALNVNSSYTAAGPYAGCAVLGQGTGSSAFGPIGYIYKPALYGSALTATDVSNIYAAG